MVANKNQTRGPWGNMSLSRLSRNSCFFLLSAHLNCPSDVPNEIPQRDILPHQVQFQKGRHSDGCRANELMFEVIPEDVPVLSATG